MNSQQAKFTPAVQTNQKHLWRAIVSAIGIGAISATAFTAPLPSGSILGITPGQGSGLDTPCSIGSCTGLEVAPGLYYWTNIFPGTDGGFILGKDQKSGGQELAPSASNPTPGELTAAWDFSGAYGTLTTVPGGGANNLFDDTPCAGAGCIGKTDLKIFNFAWNWDLIPFGSVYGCTHLNCTLDQKNGIFITDWQIVPANGGAWSILKTAVAPDGARGAAGFRFQFLLRGTVTLPNARPTTGDITIAGEYGVPIPWTPMVNDPEGDPVTCSTTTPPSHGVASVKSDCSSGSYTANVGFIGIDTFKYIARDAGGSGIAGTVTANLTGENLPPRAYDLIMASKPGVSQSWKPNVYDANRDPITCRIGTPPAKGVATVASGCSSGTYTANLDAVGTDTFTYIPTDHPLDGSASKDGAPATVKVTLHKPLPDGTILTLTPGVGSAFNVECQTGTSCFGFETAPTLFFWQDINMLNILDPDTGEIISVIPAPGNDPGIIIGKDQKSGGQELAPSATNNTPGDITGAWIFGGPFGTFYTAPGLIVAPGNYLNGKTTLGAKANLFDDTGCALSTCPGKTSLQVWNMAWNGGTIPLGQQYPQCATPSCSPTANLNIRSYTVTPEPAVEGSQWSMRYYTIVPLGGFVGFRFRMTLAGVIKMPPPPLMAADVNLSGVYGTPINWTPIITGGTPPITCRIGTPPNSGTASVAANCATGTYLANVGFIGIDMFTYIPTDIYGDGRPGTVTAAIIAPEPSPTPTSTPSGACAEKYPVSQVTLTGKQGHLTVVVTGHIVFSNVNGKEIKICPTTTASYQATTNTPGATVVCRVKHNTSTGQGRTQVNDHIKCSDKPIGNDKIHFKIKSGENKKWDGVKWV